jgi:NAD(P)-dependent dehydrogenase (short-subunit alcohol dehydrogenase family)
MTPHLHQRVILITGAAGTLGRTVALECADAGAVVILLDRQVRKLEAVYDEILERGGSEPAIYPLDLLGASEQDYVDLARAVTDEFKGLHGLVHAAAELGVLGPVADLGAAEFDRIFRINCSAPIQLTRAVLAALHSTGDASIVFIGDSSARRANAYWGAYAVAKLALEGFAHVLAEELQQAGRIRVNTLLPGHYLSPIHVRAYPGSDRGTLIGPERPARSVVYLLSPASRHLHGTACNPGDIESFDTPRDTATDVRP